MKKVIILLLGLSVFAACKKDKDAFSSVSFATVKAKEASFTTDYILVSDANGEVLKPGSIIFYHTTGGNYGKMIIRNTGFSTNHSLVFDMVTYNPQGTVVKSVNGLTIAIGALCDLDLGIQLNADGTQSFYWSSQSGDTLTPDGTATFYVYLKK